MMPENSIPASPVDPKQIAAIQAVSYIKDGMAVGLGTGSTAAFAIAALGVRLRAEHLVLRCLATSLAIEDMARAEGIPLADWNSITRLDLTIDGADEVDPQFRLIKGRGGALVREKMVAAVTQTEIIVVDDSKVKAVLGARPLPVAVLPFGWQSTRDRLQTRFGCPVTLRTLPEGTEFVSDDHLAVLDMAFGAPLPDPERLEWDIKSIVGVVEVGLFIGHCQRLIIGYADGHVEEKAAPSP